MRDRKLLFAAGGLLAALVVCIGLLQAHWISRLSEAEHRQTRMALQIAADQFSRDLDWTLASIYVQLQTPRQELPAALAALRTGRYGCLVKEAGVYHAEGGRYEPLSGHGESGAGGVAEAVSSAFRRFSGPGPFDAVLLLFLVPVHAFPPLGPVPVRVTFSPPAWITAVLDGDCLRQRVLPDLYRRSFAGFDQAPGLTLRDA